MRSVAADHRCCPQSLEGGLWSHAGVHSLPVEPRGGRGLTVQGTGGAQRKLPGGGDIWAEF